MAGEEGHLCVPGTSGIDDAVLSSFDSDGTC